MTAIPLWEATLVTLLVVVLMACAFAVVVLLMGLRNSRAAALVKEQHDKRTNELEEKNAKLAARVADLELQVRFLTELLTTNRALTPADADLLHNVGQTNSRLLMAMQLSFSPEELEVLCFEMGLTFTNIPGTTLDTKIVNLISTVQRLGRLQDLMNRVKEARPQLHLEAMT